MATQVELTPLGGAPVVRETDPDAYAMCLRAQELSLQQTGGPRPYGEVASQDGDLVAAAVDRRRAPDLAPEVDFTLAGAASVLAGLGRPEDSLRVRVWPVGFHDPFRQSR